MSNQKERIMKIHMKINHEVHNCQYSNNIFPKIVKDKKNNNNSKSVTEHKAREKETIRHGQEGTALHCTGSC